MHIIAITYPSLPQFCRSSIDAGAGSIEEQLKKKTAILNTVCCVHMGIGIEEHWLHECVLFVQPVLFRKPESSHWHSSNIIYGCTSWSIALTHVKWTTICTLPTLLTIFILLLVGFASTFHCCNSFSLACSSVLRLSQFELRFCFLYHSFHSKYFTVHLQRLYALRFVNLLSKCWASECSLWRSNTHCKLDWRYAFLCAVYEYVHVLALYCTCLRLCVIKFDFISNFPYGNLIYASHQASKTFAQPIYIYKQYSVVR